MRNEFGFSMFLWSLLMSILNVATIVSCAGAIMWIFKYLFMNGSCSL